MYGKNLMPPAFLQMLQPMGIGTVTVYYAPRIFSFR